MARTQTTAQSAQPAVLSHEEKVAQLMAHLRTPQKGQFTDRLADNIADAGQTVARLGAAFAASTDNIADAYAIERERQLKRRAEKLLALAS